MFLDNTMIYGYVLSRSAITIILPILIKRGENLNFQGIIIGFITFFIIGIYHPIVIKGEYYFGKKIWPVFLVFGLLGILLSLIVKSPIFSPLLGVFGFASLWAINEIKEQEERVKKGWFPKKPKKKN